MNGESMQQHYRRTRPGYIVENLGVIADDLLHSEIIEVRMPLLVLRVRNHLSAHRVFR
jgi:hypothetical protein